MKLLKNKIVVIILLILGVLIFILGINQSLYVSKAHSTFENYYAFRGCIKLIKRTKDYGLCKINTDQTIKIVKFKGEWYLDNDLPFCIFNVCF